MSRSLVRSRALGPVAVRGPVRVALAAGLLVAGRARRHAVAHAAALEARPGAHVLALVLAAPHVARPPAVCTHTKKRRRQKHVILRRIEPHVISEINFARRTNVMHTFGGVYDLVGRRPKGSRCRSVSGSLSIIRKCREQKISHVTSFSMCTHDLKLNTTSPLP